MNNIISILQEKEIIRKKKYKEIKNKSFEEFLFLKNQINDHFFFYSSYEHFIDKKVKSNTGAVYTPEWVCVFMINTIIDKWLLANNNLWELKLLDPCCGSGNFTEKSTEIIINRLSKLYPEKKLEEIVFHVLNNCIYAFDINKDALNICKKRIFELYGQEAKNVSHKNTLFECNDDFDIIVGNPPYGDLLSKEDKIKLTDNYNNIALTFVDFSLKHIKKNGEISLIIPHSFTRTKDCLSWRKKLFDNKNLHSIYDVGNPFHSITLEEIIICLNNNDNNIIFSKSFKDNSYEKNIDINDFYNKTFYYKMVLYFDNFFKFMNKNAISYPFSGHRGHELNKKNLLSHKEQDSFWFILGKNIKKNELVSINGYDKYIKKTNIKEKFIVKDSKIAITQFGTNLKACLLDGNCYPSGGVVIVESNLNQKECLNYLNNQLINRYLKRYIFNNADFTVHIDGIYLKEIPYVDLSLLDVGNIK